MTCPHVSPRVPSVLRYFLEYQWFVDFAVYASAVYVFSEGYFCLVSPSRETNLGVLWCLLSVIFSMYPIFWGARWKSEPPHSCFVLPAEALN